MENSNSLLSFIDLLGTIFKQMFSLYKQLSDFKNQMIAAALGIDPIVVSVVGYFILAISIAMFIKKMISK